MSDTLRSTMWRDSWRSNTIHFSLLFSGDRTSTASLRHFLTNSPSSYGFLAFGNVPSQLIWCKCCDIWLLGKFLEQSVSAAWLFKVNNLPSRSAVPSGNSCSMEAWSDMKWYRIVDALKCTGAWQIWRNGLPLRLTKNMISSTLVKASCVHLHIFVLLSFFSQPFWEQPWYKLFTSQMIYSVSSPTQVQLKTSQSRFIYHHLQKTFGFSIFMLLQNVNCFKFF